MTARCAGGVTLLVSLVAVPFLCARTAAAQLKVGCTGEQTTHSLHRENDPEYPELLGPLLDPTFVVDTSAMHPEGGGFLYGGGSSYRIGNFGHPRGTVLDHALDNPKAILRSEELTLAEAFAPDAFVLGPFGDHESLTGVSMDEFTPDLRTLIDRVQAFASQPTIFLALPLPRSGTDGDTVYRRINTETGAVARERQLRVIDLWTSFLGRTELYVDATHLTEAGRGEMARVVRNAIVAWQAEPGGGMGGSGGMAGAGGFGGFGGSGAGSESAGTGGSGLGGASGASGASGAEAGAGASGGAAGGSAGAPTGGVSGSGSASGGNGGAQIAPGGTAGSGAAGADSNGSADRTAVTPNNSSGCAVSGAGSGHSSIATLLVALSLALRRRRGRR